MFDIPYTLDTTTTHDPTRAHADDAAYDLRAKGPGLLEAQDTAFVPTGLKIAIPEGYAGLVLPRSGLAFEAGITVLNSPGLIDPGYRGEIAVLLHNTRPNFIEGADGEPPIIPNPFGTFKWEAGDRIAQLLIVPTSQVGVLKHRLNYVTPEFFEEVLVTKRGKGGFGSTGR